MLGGSIADVVDRRKLVLVTSSLLTLVSVGFAAQAYLNLQRLWLLYILTMLQSSLVAIDAPTRRTFVSQLLPPERIPAANALLFLTFQVSLVTGPLLAGVIIAAWGSQAAYLVDAVSFIFAIYSVLRLRPMPTEWGGERARPQAVVEGLRFLRHQPILMMVLIADLDATIFGMPFSLFPALAVTHFGGGARTVGLLYAAPGIGGLISATFSGHASHLRRQGMAVLLAVGVWGAAIAGFALTHLLWLAMILLAIAGAADVVNGVFRTTMLQINTPDALLGRVSSVGYVVGTAGPQLGNLEAGAVATLTSSMVSAVSGGLVCVIGAIVLGLTIPMFARYDADKARHALTIT